MSQIGTYELHSTYERHGFKTRFVLSRSKACQSMTQELEMVDESFKKNMFQLARILIFLGKSHFPSVIGWGREIHLKHFKNRIKVNKILPLEWQSGVLNYKILSLLFRSWKPLPNLKYTFHLCHKFCHAFNHNSFIQDKMFQKWGTHFWCHQMMVAFWCHQNFWCHLYLTFSSTYE